MKKVFNKIKQVTSNLVQSDGCAIIVGGTEVSIQLADRLSQLGQEIIIIEEDIKLCKQIQERLDCLVIQGLATKVETRKESKFAEATLVIAVTNNDQYNLLTGIYAKKSGVKEVIVQITDEDLYDEKMQGQNLGLDLVLNPFAMAVKRIKGLVNSGTELELKQILDNRVKINKFKISHQNRLAYQEVRQLDLGQDALLITILRKGRALLPQSTEKLYPGDLLFVISRRGIKNKISDLINTTTQKDKLILAGAGEINQKLACFFSKGTVVTIIEEQRAKGQELAENLEDILVLEGSTLDLDLLQEEGVAQTDVFVAGTEDQKQNLLVAALAQKLGSKKTIALVDEIFYSNLDDYLELDYSICPALLAIDTILDYLHQGQLTGQTVFGGQIKAHKLTFKSKRRKSIDSLNLPADLVIVLIWRGDEVIIPSPEQKLAPQDELLVFTILALEEVESYLYKV
ncbi:NAD-binding protein [Halanaerobacter jeridensis]|uniref:Trk system potassium uptake protein TrkA n=1 Tax=Halanaerobacter jeridensis TaxID=706427 RepID=A0A938XNJ4_9FIRM|nr:NAD-binding protein [Halanaerobacter jeridensis]MBM7555823.1 trk system potassium uptake protein TrkA [Halanaerobacter jeridensis]